MIRHRRTLFPSDRRYAGYYKGNARGPGDQVDEATLQLLAALELLLPI